MSKSKGNVIDPLEVINGCSLQEMMKKIKDSPLSHKEKNKAIKMKKKKYPQGILECGSDSLRFGLLYCVHHSKDINLDLNIIIKLRNFCNKIWQSFKFIMMNLGDNFVYDQSNIKSEEMSFTDKWILSNLNNTVKSMNANMAVYKFREVTTAFEDFWTNKLCAIYLEHTKIALKSESDALRIKTILFYVVETSLKLLHPFMVFISEELYQKLPSWPGKAKSLLIAQYPEWKEEHNFKGVELFDEVQAIVKEIRGILSQVRLPPRSNPSVYITVNKEHKEDALKIQNECGDLIGVLCNTAKPIISEVKDQPANCFSCVAIGKYTINIDLIKLIDIKNEMAMILKNIGLKQKALDSLIKKQSNKNYIEKVPQHVKDAYCLKFQVLTNEIKALTETRNIFKANSE